MRGRRTSAFSCLVTSSIPKLNLARVNEMSTLDSLSAVDGLRFVKAVPKAGVEEVDGVGSAGW